MKRILISLNVVALLFVPQFSDAKGPFDDFPDLISFTGDLTVGKMGNVAFDNTGNVYVAVVSRSAFVRIDAEDLSRVTVAIFPADPANSLYAYLNTPNSIAFGTGKGSRKNLLVTNLGMLPVPQPGPGLVKIETEAPGLPPP